MPNPRSFPDSPISTAEALLAFVNQLWLPDYRQLKKKLGAMLNAPSLMAEPFWDGVSWHSMRVGSDGGALPDINSLIDPANGTIYIAREGSLSADRTYQPVAGGYYDRLTFFNLTPERTITIGGLASNDMVLPPGYVGVIAGSPAAFAGLWREPLTLDPTRIP